MALDLQHLRPVHVPSLRMVLFMTMHAIAIALLLLAGLTLMVRPVVRRRVGLMHGEETQTALALVYTHHQAAATWATGSYAPGRSPICKTPHLSVLAW